jgi:hypothetical protein
VPLAPPMLKLASLFRTMSPARVPPSGPDGVVIASTLPDSGRAAIRMSPNRGSPWLAPSAPSASPLSTTTSTLMLAYWAHVCTARRISASQAAVAAADVLPIMPNRLLPTPSTSVPLGTKLSVRWRASVHGTPKTAGTVRSSSRSMKRAEGRAIKVPLRSKGDRVGQTPAIHAGGRSAPGSGATPGILSGSRSPLTGAFDSSDILSGHNFSEKSRTERSVIRSASPPKVGIKICTMQIAP